MAIYYLSTRINANVPASFLLYDLCIYRLDANRNKSSLLDVKQQSFKENYDTQSHRVEIINGSLSTIYIMEVTLYRKTMLHTHCVSPEPFTKMYTLEEFASGRAWSPIKRENPCYFESKGTAKPESQGGETKVIQITRPIRPFIAKSYPIGSSFDPFEKNKVEADIQKRINLLSYPSQAGASLCGPAAFFYCLQKDRPDVYAQAARELWRFGKTTIGKLEIVPGEGCRHPEGDFYDNISGLDWMTLASLRDSENAIFSYDVLNSPLAGITLWSTLTEWFEKAGYEKVFSNVGITQAGLKGIQDLNEYVNKGYKVVTLVSDSLLQGSLSEKLTIPNHWIVWDKPVTQDAKGNVNLRLFSWGELNYQVNVNKDMSFFIKRFFGGVVFRPLS